MRYLFLGIAWLFGYKWRVDYFRYLVKNCRMSISQATLVAHNTKKGYWLEIKEVLDSI